jgi:hypothetical protein
MKVIMVRDTPPNGHAPTYQLLLTYLERKNVMAWKRKYYLKKQLFDLITVLSFEIGCCTDGRIKGRHKF